MSHTRMITLVFFSSGVIFLCLNLMSCLCSCNTNTQRNILMMLGTNVEQDEMTCCVQEWHIRGIGGGTFGVFFSEKAFLVILCKSFFNFLLLFIACPCHEISWVFMKIICGDYGHIKARWDNHHNCLKCSSCSRLLTCSTCSTWSEETWILADKHRTYISKKICDDKEETEQEEKTGPHFRSIWWQFSWWEHHPTGLYCQG